MFHLLHLSSLHALEGRQKNSTAPRFLPYLVEAPTLVGQADPAGPTAAGKDLAAVGGGHPLAEAVDLAALALLGLIGTNHGSTPPVLISAGPQAPSPQRRKLFRRGRRFWRVLEDAENIIMEKGPSVNLLFGFFLPEGTCPLYVVFIKKLFTNFSFSVEKFFVKTALFVAMKRNFWYNGLD